MKGNIIATKLYEVIMENESIFLVMEYQPSDLKNLINNKHLEMNEE